MTEQLLDQRSWSNTHAISGTAKAGSLLAVAKRARRSATADSQAFRQLIDRFPTESEDVQRSVAAFYLGACLEALSELPLRTPTEASLWNVLEADVPPYLQVLAERFREDRIVKSNIVLFLREVAEVDRYLSKVQKELQQMSQLIQAVDAKRLVELKTPNVTSQGGGRAPTKTYRSYHRKGVGSE